MSSDKYDTRPDDSQPDSSGDLGASQRGHKAEDSGDLSMVLVGEPANASAKTGEPGSSTSLQALMQSLTRLAESKLPRSLRSHAQDVASTAWLRYLEQVRAGAVIPNPASYLARSIQNASIDLARNLLKSMAHEEPEDSNAEDPDAEEWISAIERNEAVVRLVEYLPARERAIVERILHGDSPSTVRTTLGLSLDQFRLSRERIARHCRELGLASAIFPPGFLDSERPIPVRKLGSRVTLRAVLVAAGFLATLIGVGLWPRSSRSPSPRRDRDRGLTTTRATASTSDDGSLDRMRDSASGRAPVPSPRRVSSFSHRNEVASRSTPRRPSLPFSQGVEPSGQSRVMERHHSRDEARWTSRPLYFEGAPLLLVGSESEVPTLSMVERFDGTFDLVGPWRSALSERGMPAVREARWSRALEMCQSADDPLPVVPMDGRFFCSGIRENGFFVMYCTTQLRHSYCGIIHPPPSRDAIVIGREFGNLGAMGDAWLVQGRVENSTGTVVLNHAGGWILRPRNIEDACEFNITESSLLYGFNLTGPSEVIRAACTRHPSSRVCTLGPYHDFHAWPSVSRPGYVGFQLEDAATWNGYVEVKDPVTDQLRFICRSFPCYTTMAEDRRLSFVFRGPGAIFLHVSSMAREDDRAPSPWMYDLKYRNCPMSVWIEHGVIDPSASGEQVSFQNLATFILGGGRYID